MRGWRWHGVEKADKGPGRGRVRRSPTALLRVLGKEGKAGDTKEGADVCAEVEEERERETERRQRVVVAGRTRNGSLE